MKHYIIIIALSMSFLYINGQNKNDLTSYEADSLYNGRILAETWLNHSLDSLNIDCDNNKAIKVYLMRLRMIDNYIHKHRPTYVHYFIVNFEFVTGIESESDGSYIGKVNPTMNDVKKWGMWLKNNKKRLCYYKRYNILFIRTK